MLIQIAHRDDLRIRLAEETVGVAAAHHAIAEAGHGDAIIRRRPALLAQHRIGNNHRRCDGGGAAGEESAT